MQTFLTQEYTTQSILKKIGAHDAVSPSEVAHVGTLLLCPELIPGLRVPYALEVLGMPKTGKTLLINRYLRELWDRNERNLVAHAQEGAEKVKDEYGDLRYTEPFTYSMIAGTSSFLGYIEAINQVNAGMRMIISDRGQIDRRVFRRTLFTQGNVNPQIMKDEDEFMSGLENTPVQMGGIIMLMAKPETIMQRGKPGPVLNKEFLPKLYEQYWRLHWEVIQGEVPYRIYTCIDAEKDPEDVYERFKYAADSILNIHTTFRAALAQAFPDEFDRIMAERQKQPRKHHRSKAARILSQQLGGKNVLIVGGDEMQNEDEILGKQYIEGHLLKK